MQRLIFALLSSALLLAGDPAPSPATYAPMIERVGPAVVTVHTSKAAPQRRMIMPFAEDDPFRFFFGDPRGRRGAPGGPAPRQVGQGSGVIVTADGVIVTNNHVVDGADQIDVQLHGEAGRRTAKLVGSDPKTDLAVLRIEATGLRPIVFADSSQVRVGDLAFAIGNPFGVGHSVSMGIVSATSRAGVGLVDYEDFIQTDASINPGNSGGALVDSLGRLIGINTAIYSRGGGNIGIGFAVPANLTRRVLDQLIDGGKVVRGYLGVQIGEVTPELARAFKVEAGKGALVSEVLDGTPAARAGLKAGDVILRVGTMEVADPRQLRLHIAELSPGTEVELRIKRDGAESTLKLTVGELPGEAVAEGGRGGDGDGVGRIGVALQDLTVQVRQQLDLPARIQGALVGDVEPGSRAERGGLRQGMVITEVDRQAVTDGASTIERLRKATGEILLRVWAEGGSRWLVLPE